LLVALIGFGLQQACADTIELKEKAAVVGKVLAEKPDQVAVDVGYTILVIPRSQVVRILRDNTLVPATKSPAVSKSAVAATSGNSAEVESAFYSAPNKPESAHTVLELVKQIGEAVVLHQRGRFPHYQLPCH
jgi:serine protease Do